MRQYFSLILALSLVFAVAASAQELAPASPSAPPAADTATTAGGQPGASERKGPPDYQLAAGDILKITVFDEPNLTGSYKIDSDGAFEYPFLKRVVASGKTLRQIEADIRTGLADGWVRDPQVNVDIDQYRPRSIYVVGEVRTPGKQPLVGQETLIEALAQAGYLTPTAGTEVLVLHADPNDVAGSRQLAPEQTSAERTTRVNFAQMQEGKLAQNVILQDGDTILVPKAQRFFVMGQVKTTGPQTWEPGMTVRQALALAGGLTDKGSDRRLKVIRMVDGKEKKLDIDLNDIVQPNDTIEVPQRLL
jgi:polysaccharide export outer membrane protein